MMAASVRGHVALHAKGVLGHVYDPADLTRRWAVELLVDGWAVGLARADAFAPDVADIGDGCYGFGFDVAEALLDGDALIDVRLANTEASIAAPLRLSRDTRAEAPPVGRVAWTGGLRLTGWVTPDAASPPGVVAIVERRDVASAAARGWTSVGQGAVRSTMAAFVLDLPLGYADGRVHRVTVLDRAGRPLVGSPCAVLAFPDGLRDHLMRHAGLEADDPRVAVVERTLPASIPFADWMAWRGRQPAAPRPGETTAALPVLVLLVGDAPPASLASLADQDGADWTVVQAASPAGPGTFAPQALRDFLERETETAAVVVALAGTVFEPGGVERLADAVRRHDAVVYGDAIGGREGEAVPLLWPAYDAERQREQGYAALVFAAPRGRVAAALGRGAASVFALFLDLAAGRGRGGPVHLPEPVARLPQLAADLALTLARASRIDGRVTAVPQPAGALPAAHVRRRPGPEPIGVAVIQPDGASADLARLDGLLGAGERILVTQRPVPVPAGWRNAVVAGPRNPSRLRDAAVRGAACRRLLLLDAGLYPEDGDALEEMAGRLEADRVVAVSGLDLTPDGLVLSAGLVLGPAFDAVPAFAGAGRGTPGYGDGLRVARGCGALDARCLLVERAGVLEAGGFDDVLFPEHYGGADLSLKLRAAGRRLIVTPHARFIEAAAWPVPPTATRRAELRHFRDRWAESLAQDPFYHPALNRDADPFSGLAWPPRPAAPRRADGEDQP